MRPSSGRRRHAPLLKGFATRLSLVEYVLSLLLCLGCHTALAVTFDRQFDGVADAGQVGLLQTPTARNLPDGEFVFGISMVRPYQQGYLNLQVLPWLDALVRYTRITNRHNEFPGPGSGGVSQDKSADLKIALAEEGQYTPAIALGITDIGGTGEFSSEYLVSSYHFYDLDFSLGMGWGRLASGSHLYNPLRLLSRHFDNSRVDSNAGSGSSVRANTGLSRLFTGESIGFFGGVQWNTPLPHLAFRVEFDPNDYRHEALGNVLPQSSHINIGLSYQPLRWLTLGVGYERGDAVMAHLAMRTNFNRSMGPVKIGSPPPPSAQSRSADAELSSTEVRSNTAGHSGMTGKAATGEVSNFAELGRALNEQGYILLAADEKQDDHRLIVWLSQNRYRNPALALGRAARVLDDFAPPSIHEFELVSIESGLENYRVKIPRVELRKAEGQGNTDLLRTAVRFPPQGTSIPSSVKYRPHIYPKWSWDTGPGYRQSIGGSDVFYAYQLYWFVDGDVHLAPGWSVDSEISFDIHNNFDQLTLPSNSQLPHVRSDVDQYLQQGANGLTRLETNYLWKLAPALYGRLSAGIFEEMYAGVAAELLFKPFTKPWALGIDLNRVRQRDYDERFSLRAYQITTGHATLYYQLPFYGLLTQISYGRYLAGDWGVTLDISREFRNGVRAGVFATKTSVSTSDFGEGSFDKGLYISVPFDLFLDHYNRRQLQINFRPLLRDGGQPVRDGTPLYPIIRGASPADFVAGWNDVMH